MMATATKAPKLYSQKEVDTAERSLAKRRTELEEARQWAATQVQREGCQPPGKYEIEQAERAVWTAEATLDRAKRRPRA